MQLADRGIDLGTYPLTPIRMPDLHAQWLGQWWSDFTAQTKRQIDATDTPPWVQPTWSRCCPLALNLPLPNWYGKTSEDRRTTRLMMTLQWIGGAAEVSNSVFAAAAIGSELDQTITRTASDVTALDMPPAIQWQTNSEPDYRPIHPSQRSNRSPTKYPQNAFTFVMENLRTTYGSKISRMNMAATFRE